MWRKEYRIVYYSWEFDTLQSFYRDLLRLPQMYGWYTSPVDRGCKFKIGDNRLELICRHPTLPQGPAGMRLEAKDIELCYANLKKEPRVTVIRPLQSHPWGEYSFCIKEACSQSYATDAEAVSILRQICDANKIPYQIFVNRSDVRGGGTLGSVASTLLPVKTVDIGIPLLAMHSARELMGEADMRSLADAVRYFMSV